jgi:chemotaxis signal transduction protein
VFTRLVTEVSNLTLTLESVKTLMSAWPGHVDVLKTVSTQLVLIVVNAVMDIEKIQTTEISAVTSTNVSSSQASVTKSVTILGGHTDVAVHRDTV